MAAAVRYFYSNRRWRNPDDEQDLMHLKTAWERMTQESIVFAGQCRWEKFIAVVRKHYQASQSIRISRCRKKPPCGEMEMGLQRPAKQRRGVSVGGDVSTDTSSKGAGRSQVSAPIQALQVPALEVDHLAPMVVSQSMPFPGDEREGSTALSQEQQDFQGASRLGCHPVCKRCRIISRCAPACAAVEQL
jgi:hypothetical protein